VRVRATGGAEISGLKRRPGETVAKPVPIWHSSALVRRNFWPDLGCGCSSGVEHDLAKVGVEGSNPFARSNTSIT
jgi:hypothetical protein